MSQSHNAMERGARGLLSLGWIALICGAALNACAPESTGRSASQLPLADPNESEAPLSDRKALLSDAPDPATLPDEQKADQPLPPRFDLVESQSPAEIPLDLSQELHIRADKFSVAYRRWLADLGVSWGVAR